MSGYNPYSTQYNPYQPTSGGSGYSSYRSVNFLEIGVVLVSIIALIGVFWWGLGVQNTTNRDRQREQDINQILLGLADYYKNSSTIPSERFYPKAVCSESLNEVDFEYALRQNLTGKRPDLDTHVYISGSDFPKDKWGEYSTTFSERKVPYRCTEKVAFGTITPNQNIYPDAYPSCNFSQAKKILNCYLYTSSNSGDTFKLGYYQESQNKFVAYRKFREDKLLVESL